MFKKYRTNRRIVLIFLSFLLIFVAFFAYQDRNENRNIIQSQPIALNDGWTIVYDGNILEEQKLPSRISVLANTEIKMTTLLPNIDNDFDALLIRSSMQDVQVSVNDEIIYTYQNVDNGLLDSPTISTWLLVRLPDNFQGQTLTITLSSTTDFFAGALNKVQIGAPDALVMSVLSSQNVPIIIFMILFITGLILILVCIFIRNIQDNRLIYLGLFAISTGIWILSEARVMPFLTGNRFLIGATSYLMIFLMAGSLALYVKEAIMQRERHKKYLQMLSGLYFTGFVLVILLQESGIQTFIGSIEYTLIVVAISIILIAYMFYVEHHYDHNQKVIPMVKYSFLLIISIAIETIIFYTEFFDFTSHVFRIGILLFFILLIYDTIKALKHNIEVQQQQAILEVLAYQDILINGNNRTRFEHDIRSLTVKKKSYRLIIVDMNDLKIINDQMGHASGDQALQQVYSTLDTIFTDQSYGKPYRIGGDEFAIISEVVDEDIYHHKSDLLFENINKHELPFMISLAIGSDVYIPNEWRQFSEFYQHVDHLMYEHKRFIKQSLKH